MDKEYIYTTDGKVRHFSVGEDINKKLSSIIGRKFVRYRKLWDAANRFELETEFPLFLHLDMNQNCNLRCPHCIIGQTEFKGKYYTGNNLSWDDFKLIVEEGEKYECPSISPQGNNEPLLIKNLEQYIRYAHDHGFIDIMMNTNAMLLTEERARTLLDSGLTRIRFSLDAATTETYNRIRIGGDFNIVTKNIERFLQLKESGGYKLPITGVSFCKMSTNEQELDAFFDHWRNKVDIVSVQIFVPPILEKDFSNYYPLDQFIEDNGLKDFRCPQPFQRVVIRNNDITPCCAMFSSKLKIGDLRKNSIYEAWNSKSMKQLREIHKNGEYFKNNICKDCVSLIYPRKK